MTARELKAHRAILAALNAVPSDMPLPDEVLRADAARLVVPRLTTTELDNAINRADTARRIAGINDGETGQVWQITNAGKLWLAQNP